MEKLTVQGPVIRLDEGNQATATMLLRKAMIKFGAVSRSSTTLIRGANNHDGHLYHALWGEIDLPKIAALEIVRRARYSGVDLRIKGTDYKQQDE